MVKYLNVVLFCGMLVVNYLANALPLNNRTTGEISDSFPNLFVPAGITFSIWGIIYLLLLGYCILQFKHSYQPVVSETGWLFGISCLFNALWIVFWHYGRLPLSLVTMAGLLASLILLNMALTKLPGNFAKVVFGVYLGWICIATIANITALLVHYRWNGFGVSEVTWTIIMIAAGALITVAALYRLSNPYLALSVIWAYTGIIIKRQNDFKSIALAAGTAIVIVAVAAALQFLRKSSPVQL